MRLDAVVAYRRLMAGRVATVIMLGLLGLGAAVALSVTELADQAWFGAPPGVHDAQLVRRVYAVQPRAGDASFSPLFSSEQIRELSSLPGGIASIGGFREQEMLVEYGDSAVTERAALVTGNLFGTLQVVPSTGSVSGLVLNGGVAVSDRWARRRAKNTAAVVGREIRIGQQRSTIVAVLPPGFLGPEAKPIDVWGSAHELGAAYLPRTWDSDPDATFFTTLLRVSARHAAEAVEQTASVWYLGNRGPSLASREQPRVLLAALPPAYSPIRSEDAQLKRVLTALAVLLWLTIAANMAGLVLAQSLERERAVLTTLSLGASPWRVVRPLALEAALIGGASIGMAVPTARRLSRALVDVGLATPVNTYQAHPAHAWFVFSGLLVSAIVLATIPALWRIRHLRDHVGAASYRLTSERSMLPRILLFLQVCFASGVMYVACLLMASYFAARRVPLGFETTGLLAVTVRTAPIGLSVDQMDRVYTELADRARHSTGVSGASIGVSVPFYTNLGVHVSTPNNPAPATAYIDVISPEYFETMAIPVRAGRVFTSSDSSSLQPIAIVTERLGATLFGGESPIGRCVIVNEPPCRTVVGVVGDVMQVDLRSEVSHIYLPLSQAARLLPSRTLFVRSPDTATIEGRLTELAGLAAPGAPTTILRMTDVAAAQLRPWRLSAVLLAALGAIALVVSSVGTFGMVSRWVTRHRDALAIRVALGSPLIRVVELLTAATLPAVLGGIAAGIALGGAIATVASKSLFAVHAIDATAIVLSCTLPVVFTLLALTPVLRRLRERDLIRFLRT